MSLYTIQKLYYISKEQADFLEKNGFSFSKYVRIKINEDMKK